MERNSGFERHQAPMSSTNTAQQKFGQVAPRKPAENRGTYGFGTSNYTRQTTEEALNKGNYTRTNYGEYITPVPADQKFRRDINNIRLSGIIKDAPVFSHEVAGESLYQCLLEVRRLSENSDLLPLTISEKLMEGLELSAGTPICVEGQVRSYNKLENGNGKLVLTVFAQRLKLDSEDTTDNHVEIYGTLCKQPSPRVTPFGRRICDMMIAINRPFGKSDYIPVIAWGRLAQDTGHMKVGDRLHITGRLQSRVYQKLVDVSEIVEKTAYEVSVFSIIHDNVSANVM